MNTPESRAAYINSQSTAAMIEVIAMRECNEFCRQFHLTPVYTQEQFREIIDKYGLSHNSVVSFLNGEMKP